LCGDIRLLRGNASLRSTDVPAVVGLICSLPLQRHQGVGQAVSTTLGNRRQQTRGRSNETQGWEDTGVCWRLGSLEGDWDASAGGVGSRQKWKDLWQTDLVGSGRRISTHSTVARALTRYHYTGEYRKGSSRLSPRCVGVPMLM